MTTTPTSRPRPIGYRIVLPPGWAGIPLLARTEEAIAAILDAAGAGLPDRNPDGREAIAEQLRKLATEARANNGAALYLPIATVHGITVPATITVFDISFGSLDPPDPALLTTARATAPNAAQVIVAGAACTRTERTCPADPAHAVPLPSRRVDYLLPFPEDPDRWILVVFTALRLDDRTDDLSTEWVALFDAMMTTFRWRSPN